MATLAFDIEANWNDVHAVTDRAHAFFSSIGAPRESADALAMIATELSENAVKYGDASTPVSVRLGADGSAFAVEVSNVVGPRSIEELERLDEMVQWIRGYQDPFQAYVERLREVSAQRLDDSRSGLGLVRVAYEGRAILDFIVDSKSRLTVSAVRREF